MKDHNNDYRVQVFNSLDDLIKEMSTSEAEILHELSEDLEFPVLQEDLAEISGYC